MIKKIVFPKNTDQHYYHIHYQYVLDLFRYCNIEIELKEIPEINETAFKCYIDNKEVIFDFSDSGESITESEVLCFKFHYKDSQIAQRNCYPFLPVCFYYDDWKRMKYQALNYIPSFNNLILFNQREYGNAIQRRNQVKKILIKEYGMENVDTFITDKYKYWRKIENCLCSVFVPGANNNMLDRAQLEFMFFGCCTISPKLPEVLLDGSSFLKEDYNYIKCKDDYSDLIEIINGLIKDKDYAQIIGDRAKRSFENINPGYIIDYIRQSLKYY